MVQMMFQPSTVESGTEWSALSIRMTVDRRVGRRGAIVSVSGEVCLSTASTLAAALAELREKGCVEIELRVDRLDLCAAAGCRVLLRERFLMEEQGGWLRIHGATGIVARVLEIADLV